MIIESLLEDLKRYVEEYEPDKAKQVAKELLEAQADPLLVIEEVLGPMMEEIGEKFDKFEIFLPDLMCAAEAMQAATTVLTKSLKESEIERPKTKGKIVIGTVHGDIHEIGKDIVKTMLEVQGFEVFDLGKDVPSMRFIEKAEEVNADIIALSALMTSTMSSQKEVIELLTAMGRRDDYVVLIGGAPTSLAWQKEIGSDGWGQTAAEAGKLAIELIEKKTR
ncbi:MAG: B12-binding domain-containing protein [Promethearchaeota archaeon]